MEFPRLVYLSAHHHTLVNDQEEFDAAIASGWFATVPECTTKTPTPPEQEATTVNDESLENAENAENADSEDLDDDIPEPTREELEAKARELGIGFNGNTKDETLLKKIEDALAEQG